MEWLGSPHTNTVTELGIGYVGTTTDILLSYTLK